MYSGLHDRNIRVTPAKVCTVKVTYRESGGFAGLCKSCELDTAHLPEAVASQLASLVDQCDFAALTTPDSSGSRDLVHCEIIIEDEGVIRTLRFDDVDPPPAATALWVFLKPWVKPCPPW